MAVQRRHSRIRHLVPTIEKWRRQGVSWAGVGRLLLAQGIWTKQKWRGDRDRAAHALASLAFHECKLAKAEPELHKPRKRRSDAELDAMMNGLLRARGLPEVGWRAIYEQVCRNLGIKPT